MNLMPCIALQAKDVISQLWQLWLTTVTTVPSALRSLAFFFRLKKKISLMKPLTLSRTFPYLLIFPWTKFWFSYIAWLYIKRTKLHTKRLIHLSLIPKILKLHFVAYISKLFYTSPSPLQKYLFLDDTITSHLLHHTITHYPSLLHFNTLKLHHFATQKHISISFFISHTKSPFL